ncbi:MAG: DISARM system SNF2-like helicase DrmD [Planctomycetota bacterium]
MPTTKPSAASLLAILTKARLVDLGREYGLSVRSDVTKDEQIRHLTGDDGLTIDQALRWMGREELRAACRAHGLDDSGRARAGLAKRLAEVAGVDEAAAAIPLFRPRMGSKDVPHAGDIAQVRHRQYLVEKVIPPPDGGHATLVQLVCLDDDDQGRPLEVLWELELGARILHPEVHGLGEIRSLDSPRRFGAYLHTLKWNAVTATDARLFQAPFRAGIRILDHQLTPLKKALELPRANLFIADDVGLGKTIEAGLVLQELILRQRVRFTVVVAPAAICLQWRDEMEKRFGLHFEIYNRKFVARRRQERGFQVNPWTTHNHFIISYPLLRRPEYRDPLIQRLEEHGHRLPKSLLILDEAHTCAPATASRYATDSRITKVVRDMAPRFENRLFLSATPHNGHSNSFSSLLHILDPQRFTPGVPAGGVARLRPVMVRRLKEDLRQVGAGEFPIRDVIPISLRHDGGAWSCRFGASDPIPLAPYDALELELSDLLAEYTTLMRPKKGRGRLVFINLQKRLLSSVEAFIRTLRVHVRGLGKQTSGTEVLAHRLAEGDDDEYGEDEDAQDQMDAEAVESATAALSSPAERAGLVLARMQEIAEQKRSAADAKVLALLHWIRRHQCPAVMLGGAAGSKDERAWTGARVIVFTEYGDTKRYLLEILRTAFEGTDLGAERILQFHGGMGDDQRDAVQRAFNSPPDEHPVRVLIATDAAREGVNLQGHCADLFHFDVPWNPARMEQRNGRIDRTLQPSKHVRCHYFLYAQRREDLVLQKLVEKVATIQAELGSLGAVLMSRMASALDDGIGTDTEQALEFASDASERAEVVKEELEAPRRDLDELKREIDEAGKILNGSRSIVEFDHALLREAIDAGLDLVGLPPLVSLDLGDEKIARFRLPEMPPAWQETVDVLRPARQGDEPIWEWRRRPPLPVVFKPPRRMNDALVQLHLEHPFVRRVLSRFRSQGYSANDLSRVTVVRNPHDSIARVIAFGRLSLFGAGAARLHDRLISVAAQWLESGGAGHLRPFADRADRRAIERLEELLAHAQEMDPVSDLIQARLVSSAAADFASLWTHIQDEADHQSQEAEVLLRRRGDDEAAALKRILEAQRQTISKTLKTRSQTQTLLRFLETEGDQREQYEEDSRYMQGRLAAIDDETEREPAQIKDLYNVLLRRLEPVGLVYLWPETRA